MHALSARPTASSMGWDYVFRALQHSYVMYADAQALGPHACCAPCAAEQPRCFTCCQLKHLADLQCRVLGSVLPSRMLSLQSHKMR